MGKIIKNKIKNKICIQQKQENFLYFFLNNFFKTKREENNVKCIIFKEKEMKTEILFFNFFETNFA